MRIPVPMLGLLTWLMMRAAVGQDQPRALSVRVTHVDIDRPVADFVLCDADGDGLGDAWFLTKTRPALVVVCRRMGANEGFGPGVALEIEDGCDGLILKPGLAGTALLLLEGKEMAAKTLADFAPLAPGALPRGVPPVLLGFAGDFDGDRIGDPLVPDDAGFELAMSKSGRRIAIRPPIVRERSAGMRGLASERMRFPLVSLDVLATGTPPRPLFFANDALLALQGSFDSGFGPAVETILKVPSPKTESTLERTEARLVDIDGDGTRELLVVRTKTQGAALGQIKTELIFHRIGGGTPGRPAQAILLPGILSSGPDVKDVDGDGRLDLFLSVFGEDLTQQVTRRITGRVKLEYLLYRGAASGPPFSRSPDFTETDSIPEATFGDWSLRHRLMLDDDWTGDGLPDLVQMTVTSSTTRFEVRAGAVVDGKAQFRKNPAASAEAPQSVRDHRAWRLGPSEPAILCRTETGAVIFSAKR